MRVARLLLDRVAAYGLPIASVGVAAVVLFGPGALKPSVGTRVWGRPGPSNVLALRIEGVRRYLDIDDSATLEELEVEVSGADFGERLGSWRGPAGGIVTEVSIPLSSPLRGATSITVRGCAGECTGASWPLLATGTFPAAEREPLARRRTLLAGTRTGDLEITVEVVRGTLAPPFAEQTVVRVRDAAGKAVPEAFVELTGAGLEAVPEAGARRATTDSSGECKLSVRALAHVGEYEVTARAPDGRSGKLGGPLPVHAGGLWLEPGSGREVTVVSPIDRPDVFLSLDDDRGRVFGAIVPLKAGPDRLARGTALLPPDGALLGARLTLSADIGERGPATTGWPLGGGTGSFEPKPMELLVDGAPQGAEIERQRAWRTRRAALWLLAFTAVFEALYLTYRARSVAAAGRRRRPAPGETPEEELVIAGEGTTRSAWLFAASLIAVVLLGFAMIGALITFWR